MKVYASLEFPCKVWDVHPDFDPPADAEVYLKEQKLFVKGRQIGVGYVERVEAEEVIDMAGQHREWVGHKTIVNAILDL